MNESTIRSINRERQIRSRKLAARAQNSDARSVKPVRGLSRGVGAVAGGSVPVTPLSNGSIGRGRLAVVVGGFGLWMGR